MGASRGTGLPGGTSVSVECEAPRQGRREQKGAESGVPPPGGVSTELRATSSPCTPTAQAAAEAGQSPRPSNCWSKQLLPTSSIVQISTSESKETRRPLAPAKAQRGPGQPCASPRTRASATAHADKLAPAKARVAKPADRRRAAGLARWGLVWAAAMARMAAPAAIALAHGQPLLPASAAAACLRAGAGWPPTASLTQVCTARLRVQQCGAPSPISDHQAPRGWTAAERRAA